MINPPFIDQSRLPRSWNRSSFLDLLINSPNAPQSVAGRGSHSAAAPLFGWRRGLRAPLAGVLAPYRRRAYACQCARAKNAPYLPEQERQRFARIGCADLPAGAAAPLIALRISTFGCWPERRSSGGARAPSRCVAPLVRRPSAARPSAESPLCRPPLCRPRHASTSGFHSAPAAHVHGSGPRTLLVVAGSMP
jgi:hypothetical protein